MTYKHVRLCAVDMLVKTAKKNLFYDFDLTTKIPESKTERINHIFSERFPNII